MASSARTSSRAPTASRPDAAVRRSTNPTVPSPAAVAAGLWMRAGFIGASVCAAGIVSLLTPGLGVRELTWGLVGTVLGAILGGLAWHRTGVLLHRVDDGFEPATGGPVSVEASAPASSRCASPTAV